MFINEKKNAIELSKKEAKAAAKFGTTEYKQLQEARRDYPTFSVVTVTRKTTNLLQQVETKTYNGTYEITENDDGTMEITFNMENGDDAIKSETLTFEQGENFIKIGLFKYNKVEK
jgi:hypothetical protein